MKMIFVSIALFSGILGFSSPTHSLSSIDIRQSNLKGSDATDKSTAVISITESTGNDSAIEERIGGIYRELGGLQNTKVAVDSGVVTLSGWVAEPGDIDRARQIAMRVDGVVAVQNNLQRDGNVSQNLTPVLGRLKERLRQAFQMLPLIAIAFMIVILFWLMGSWLARAKSIWTRISPNHFLADLIATSVRLVLTLTGVVIALDLLGATTLLGAILGSAGVIGLAIGFAVKDTIDNYVSSIMLSIRQPFRANDHVVIGDREGRVIRLNSRATILMTLDGNHLRIPNNTVFKADIPNYTRNPERRFDFVLGIDAEDDPGEAIKNGTERLRELPFVLDEPVPGGRLEEVGDSSIILRFVGWINQTETDWFKARSAAIRAVKMQLEEQGFGLPEPIYRVRFDSGSPLEIARSHATSPTVSRRSEVREPSLIESADVSIENDIVEKVNEERQNSSAEDMLDSKRPVE
jgi:small-conductance mechanosensitive channel